MSVEFTVYGASCAYTLFQMLVLGGNTTPLFHDDIRIRFPEITKDPTLDRWNNWVQMHPKAKNAHLIRGTKARCFGNSLFSWSPQVIELDAKIEKIDVDAALYLCKHEFAHILHNDTVILSGISIVVTCVAMVILNAPEGLLSYLLVALVISRFIMRYQEIQADRFANMNSPVEQLEGGFRNISAMIKVGKDESKDNIFDSLSKFLVNSHPSDRYRLNLIKQQLKRRFGYQESNFSLLLTDSRFDKLCRYWDRKSKYNSEKMMKYHQKL